MLNEMLYVDDLVLIGEVIHCRCSCVSVDLVVIKGFCMQ